MIGKKIWAIAEGYIPSYSHGPEPQMTSHETVCILNATNQDATIEMTIFFSHRDPAGPYQLNVPAMRTRHFRFNDMESPEPIPRDTDYACLLRSTVPVIVQHTRMDTRQAENALLSTIAFPCDQ